VQPEPVLDPQAQLLRRAHLDRDRGGRGGLDRARRRRVAVGAELLGLRAQRGARLGGDLREAQAAARRGGGRHRALDERGVGQQHRDVAGRELDRHLGAHERAAEVHEHQHAVRRGGPVDGGHDELGVGSQRAGRVDQAARGLDRNVLAAHLAGELDDSLRQLGAVGDDDEPDAHRSP
jgi:hypothetical protein